MPLSNFDIYRAIATTEYYAEDGSVTDVTTEVFGPYHTKAASTHAWNAQPGSHYTWRRAYYTNDQGEPDYQRPKKKIRVKRQVLKPVLVITVIGNNKGVQSTELEWVDA
jgi:hypothetical protein